ncbi:DUF1682 domain protein [Truncatella angustata]|uniref:DUF1682 domain protein n=1 Tax=Truncatella angustata TaxID=152316 RepID=A0A9P8V096_9PEZI|nr:DUF1682 domain protein [Truncatella angustata]KAH6661109.1 DUF1682 domain protein [Truncatella angustata]KAH8202444.1 hypothetical protein TruAng_003344 [Truncatella angustata]
MADFLKNIIGGSKSNEPVPSADSDFADFAEAPSPTPIAYEKPPPGSATLSGGGPLVTDRPYTKWYNVHERHSLSEFKAEGVILTVIAVIFTLHFIGTRLNKAKAKAWAKSHAPLLENEFALVGFNGVPNAQQQPEKILKEKSLFEYATYATGRQNVAFVDVGLTLKKRFNPLMTSVETLLGFFIDSYGSPEDSLEATIYPFDGKEAAIVPNLPGAAELRSKDSKSGYDGFVWALVNKDQMKKFREDRYDLSITFTKDNSKLPIWLTCMSESAEITDALLTKDLAAAVEKAGDLFEALIVTDQPTEKPSTIDETTPRKRIFLRYRLPSSNNYDDLLPLFTAFLRLPDHLSASAHFRPEVLRKVKSVRDETIKQIQKVAEDEKAEERALERDRTRKAKRDAELNALDAKAQKKYLDKEKEKQMRKQSKKQTVRG